MSHDQTAPDLKSTPLTPWHEAHGGRMVPFAGYAMPVNYKEGILGEHRFTRQSAGLFDVSHMGQAFVVSDSWEKTARALEALVPCDLRDLKPGKQRYTQLLNDKGGILDDLMITRLAYARRDSWAYLVVNAARKDADYKHIASQLPDGVELSPVEDLALMALQGPQAIDVLRVLVPGIEILPFMACHGATFDGGHLHISRSGYTGEDGFELSTTNTHALALWEKLAADSRVMPVGLGARDSLRLEAGLCLYGHDIDENTTPIEAGLGWSIQKRRREDGGFPGYQRILQEISETPSRKRVGLRPLGRQPAREGTGIFAGTRQIGTLTSGGFGPSIDAPVAMGYVTKDFAKPGTKLTLMVRDKAIEAEVTKMPFVPHRYYVSDTP